MDKTHELGVGAQLVPSVKPTVSPIARKRTRQKHGLSSAIRHRYTVDIHALDRRTVLSKAIQEWRTELTNDLGGPSALSTQQAMMIDMIVRDRLTIESIENWLATQPSLVNKRKRSLYPIVQQLSSLKDGMAKRLQMVGLERRSKPVRSLSDLLQANDRPQT